MDFDYVYFPSDINMEYLDRYYPGGYHPVILGDIIRSPAGAAYQIIHKLGHGAFSTVWLADHSRSDLAPRYVALKISTANMESAREAEFLQSVPSPYIVPVFDSFDLTGPNGQHYVLVTEVLIRFEDYFEVPTPLRTTKRLIWELVKAVEELHGAGLVHGDLSLANVGVTLPQIHELDPRELMWTLDHPVLTAIICQDMNKDATSLPRYMTTACDTLKNLYTQNDGENPEPHIKLFDFGSVRSSGDATKGLQCMVLSRSPEILYALEVEKVDNPLVEPPSDVWALGTVIVQIISGGLMAMPRGYSLLSNISYFAGDPPPHWDPSHFKFEPNENLDKAWSKMWHNFRRYCQDDADCDSLVRLLRKVFTLDPAKRPSATEIVNDDWFSAGTELDKPS